MKLKDIIHSKIGKYFISILLGLGLATLFRKVCDSKDCYIFKGASEKNIANKTYKHNDKCYTYKLESKTCDKNKKIINFA